MTEGKFWGFISFADSSGDSEALLQSADRQWTDHEESILTVMAASIGGAIVRSVKEEALRESEIKFRTLYESTSAAVLLVDENRIFDANTAALQLFGCTQRQQLCDKHPYEFLPPVQPNGQDSISLAKEYVAIALQKGSYRFDWVYRKQDGQDFSAEVTLSLIKLGNRKVLQAVIHDIAERIATEKQLRQAKEAAEAGSRAKSEFLATMSHELRTPLNAVLGLSQLMRQEIFGTLNDKQREYVACIQSSGEHLLSLINDILDLSKVEAGKEQLNFVPLDIHELCESCLTLVREQAYDQGLKVTLSIDPKARICIADERRCKQMLLNLLSNAIKFTPAGEVCLIVTKEAEGVSFKVTDTGIGIPADKLPLLFEPFRQLDSGLNRQFPGTGLGLALTQSLAQLHGGLVTVESVLGQGSQFTLYLPDLPSEDLFAASSPQELAGCEGQCCSLGTRSRILLVENDERSALVLKDYLQVIGHRVEHLRSGEDFLTQVRAFQPNLILMDVHLRGDSTGFDLLATLRQEPDTKNLKVVMATALAMAGDRERCLAAGADDYLSKPIGIAQLEAILMRYL
jgi:PAS domain S-box-containing protein